MEHFAIYDMDKTITRSPTWTPFLVHTARATAPWRLAMLPAAGAATIGYAAGVLDRAALKEITQRLMIGAVVRPEAIATAVASFAAQIAEGGCYDEAYAQIAADRAAGYRLVMATASFRFYARAIAERLGFDTVIATESRFAPDGSLLARIDGENCYGAAKLQRIKAWLGGQGIARGGAHIRFYSDHVSDAPVLDWADEAVAVNPHAPLRDMAAARGWRVIDWRGA